MDRYREIHWEEGMFLRPHHFQLAFRDMNRRLYLETERVRPYSYGVDNLEFNTGLLSQYEVEILSCDVLFPGGTRIRVPDNALVERKSFRKIVEQRRGSVEVFLAIPLLNERDPNVYDSEDETIHDTRRYIIRTEEIQDENTGTNTQPIRVRRINAHILFEGESQAGFNTLRIARINPAGSPNALPVLDPNFIPSALTIKAWPGLNILVRDARVAVQQGLSDLIAKVVRREIPFGEETTGSILTTVKLQSLHRANALLHQIVESPQFHPHEVYLTFCGIVADLAIFMKGHALPEDLPIYDHNDLGRCFHGITNILLRQLEEVSPKGYDRRRFEKRDEYMECVLEESWLEPTYQYFIGVRTDRDPKEVRAKMDPDVVKVAPLSRIGQVDSLRLRGIAYQLVERLPIGLPDYPDVHYFQLQRNPESTEFWEALGKGKDMVMAIARAPQEQGISYELYILKTTARPRAGRT